MKQLIMHIAWVVHPEHLPHRALGWLGTGTQPGTLSGTEGVTKGHRSLQWFRLSAKLRGTKEESQV